MSRYGLSDSEAREPAYVHESLASSDRRSEWHAQVEAWADRLDAAKDDADKLDALCAEIDGAVGQGDAWNLAATLAVCVRRYTECRFRVAHREGARAAILDIPLPTYHEPE